MDEEIKKSFRPKINLINYELIIHSIVKKKYPLVLFKNIYNMI